MPYSDLSNVRGRSGPVQGRRFSVVLMQAMLCQSLHDMHRIVSHRCTCSTSTPTPVPRPLQLSSSDRCFNRPFRPATAIAARKSRPFQSRTETEEEVEELTEAELLTDSYLASLGEEAWAEDPPGHRAGYVAIVGRPNAGKSTLVNALVGQKLSIVTAKAQTTRHRILSLVNEPDSQMILLDTPGIMTTARNKLDARMMKSVWQAARDADALLAIVDSSLHPKEDLDSLNQVFEASEARKLPLALVLNKVDLITPGEVDRLVSWIKANCKADVVIPTAAKLGSGVADVKRWSSEQLPEGPSLYPKDVVSEEPERFFIAEIVREQIFLQYQQEIPYSSTAEVIEYTERPEGTKDLVRVVVTVESESQQAILIGKGGSALKKLSTESRQGIEEFLGKLVYLDISIKVNKGWRSDEKSVTRFGY